MAHQLPVEVIHSIIDSLGPSGVNALSNISLASRRLRAIAQLYLFQECQFALVEPLGHHGVCGEVREMIPSRASDFLELSPHLVRYIRTIKILIKGKNMAAHLSQPNCPPTSHNMTNGGLALSQIIFDATNLKEILFPQCDESRVPFDWEKLPIDLQAAIEAVAPRVVTLDITAAQHQSFPVGLFGQFGQLKHLTLNSAIRHTDGVDLKHISLDTLDMGPPDGWVSNQAPWYQFIDTTQMKKLKVSGVLNHMDVLLCSEKLTRLEWDMQHCFDAGRLSVSVPGADSSIAVASLKKLKGLQELHLHVFGMNTRPRDTSGIPVVTALMKTVPKDNRISTFILRLTTSITKPEGQPARPSSDVELDTLVSTLMSPRFAQLEKVVFIFKGWSTSGCVSEDCDVEGPVIDDILNTNPRLHGFVQDGAIELVYNEPWR